MFTGVAAFYGKRFVLPLLAALMRRIGKLRDSTLVPRAHQRVWTIVRGWSRR